MLTIVWLSYEFTLLSNRNGSLGVGQQVWLSYEFTLLSNPVRRFYCVDVVWYHMNLHYSQTYIFLHSEQIQFDYHMNLHYSQTIWCIRPKNNSLTIIWIYTTLKQADMSTEVLASLTIIWIYTTLKLCNGSALADFSLTIIWIYTTLKHTLQGSIST